MPNWLRRIEAKGIYGRFNLEQDFRPGINIIHGKNGTGKTTLLHILANILNHDFNRFAFLNFGSIKVFTDEGIVEMVRFKHQQDATIDVLRDESKIDEIDVAPTRRLEQDRLHSSPGTGRQAIEDIEKPAPILPTAYFPAFRIMMEAWASLRHEPRYIGSRGELHEGGEQRVVETNFARELFGSFVPRINYPSPQQIEERVRSEIQQAMLIIAQTDRKVLSEAFVKTFGALTKRTEDVQSQPVEILDEIKTLSDRLEQSSIVTELSFFAGAYYELRQMVPSIQLKGATESVGVRILDLYRKALRELVQVQDESFAQINRYLASVNDFLGGKRLVITKTATSRRWPTVRVGFDDGTTSPLRVLSSGERQIATLVYAATHMSKERIVLIDEPELSLHVDWQRQLLRKMSEQLGQRQIIACTHSPVIGSDFFDRMKELELKPTERKILKVQDTEPEEGI